MDCSNCCHNDLGCFPHNKDIDTGLLAEQAGVYNLMFIGPNFSRFSKLIYFAIGAAIIIPKGVLNEDFQYTFQIIQPDGVAVLVDTCPNFSFKTFINITDCDDIDYL